MPEETYDIFLSFSQQDRAVADVVAQSFTTAGLIVFSTNSIEGSQTFADRVLHALIESRALVVIATPRSVKSINVGIEVGAAMSWRKPLYILTEHVAGPDLPPILRSGYVFPIHSFMKVVDALRRGSQPLGDEDRAVLTDLYSRFQIPTDKLVSDPQSLEAFANAFNKLRNSSISGEKLTQELLRLRKSGRLPRVRRRVEALKSHQHKRAASA
jgi:hypothetical protein